VGSKSGGKLQLAINAKLQETTLTDQSSAFVQNEVQKITISSTIIPEAYTIQASANPQANLANTTGNGVIQSLVVAAIDGEAPFQLSLYGARSILIDFGASAQSVQDALNDMPLLQPNRVRVEETLAEDGVSKMYLIKFDVALGQVPDIDEVLGYVNATITQVNSTSFLSSMSQVAVDGVPSELFDLASDSADKVRASIEKSFGIRCPASISVNNKTTSFATFDYEDGCKWDTRPVNESAYCGKCASSSASLFTNLNSTLDFKYVSLLNLLLLMHALLL